MIPALAYVGLGSNLSNPRRQVERALRRIARLPATCFCGVSRMYLTAPIGAATPQPEYVNAVAVIRTRLAPRALLVRMQDIERRQGRRRGPEVERNAARTLDLDLLLYGARRMRTPVLTLPHPRMHQRAFVLRPLLDLAPAATIPGHGLARLRLRGLRGQRAVATRRPARP